MFIRTAMLAVALIAAQGVQAQESSLPVFIPKSYELANTAPEYPSESRRHGEEGTVVLTFTVNVDGSVEKIRIKKSSGFERLDSSAVQTVKDWTFKPGLRDGVPVSMT